MDANKRLELLRISYEIRGTCGICKHGQFSPGQQFGACAIHTYQHLKHTGDERPLSINAYGRCGKFEMDQEKARLGLWEEFVV